MKVRDAAREMGASASGAGAGELFDKEITGYSIDSRTVGEGELFFALSPADYARHGFTGAHFADAHDFIPDALARGAVAAVARAGRATGDAALAGVAGRLLLAEDCIDALQVLAQRVLARRGLPVVGITGSAGKTTTKDLTAHVLGAAGRRVLRSKKNYNNELGLPLSILQMVSQGSAPEDFDVAVLEMGMSTPREIARLVEIAPPDVGVELLVAPAHLEFFGTVEAIAEAKAQLVDGIKPGGAAVLNADDERVAAMRARHTRGPVVTFGIENPADVSAARIESAGLGLTRFTLRTPRGEAAAELPMPGRHNLMNALAAAAVATCFELSPGEVADALRTAAPSEMRGVVLRFRGGFTVVDDSYNSNPRSLLSMAESVAQGGEGVRRRVVVAGEMLELGADAPAMHREAGREIGGLGVDVLWGVRGLARELLAGAREAGMPEGATRFFDSSDEAAEALADFVRPGDLVLVKGSRGVQTDRAVKRLLERHETAGGGGRGGGGGGGGGGGRLKAQLLWPAPDSRPLTPVWVMIYHIFYEWLYRQLSAGGTESVFVKALNVFQYVTFRTAYATITALLISLVFGGRVIQALRRLKVGQMIREEGPQAHMAKRGTPTMGGVLIVGSVLISTLLWARLTSLYVWIILAATTGFAVIGFIDDYQKVAKKQSLGLTGRKKLIGQLLIAVGVWAALYAGTQYGLADYSWRLSLPFFKETAIRNITSIGPILYLPFIAVVLLGFSNAVNLTDGLDGLATSVTVVAMATLTAFTYVSGDARWASYLGLEHQQEIGELTVFCGAMVGASLGFLWYNAPPAEVFMGDVGSLAIGGAIGTIGVLTKQELILIVVGGVFVVEALSVMIQVGSFKTTKRRVFKMAPLHHHFEILWEQRFGQRTVETKVVFRFLIIAILFALLSLSTLKLR